ncbi:MAG: cbb3-type cytochrome c oxidase subunit 3 [Gammaproteobacteria bacterium]|nr:cbb3-type cytochrome c oxidase subunit 3 [Gammaproteobacteria bacterium]
MDLHDFRGLMTAVILLTFLALFIWTWMGSRDRFRDAAELPFADDDEAGRDGTESRGHSREVEDR